MSDANLTNTTYRITIGILVGVAGVAVSSIFVNQPLLGGIGGAFPLREPGVGAIPAATQMGYAGGMLLLAPLGDRFDRRKLILLQMVGLLAALVCAGLSTSLLMLAAASLAIGIFATATQHAIPFAAEIAPKEYRGRAVGTVMSGLFAGILLARTISGAIGQCYGWRAVFFAFAGAVAVLALVVWAGLPRSRPASTLSYGKLLVSMSSIAVESPQLRQAALIGGAMFASFNIFWASLPLMLTAEPFMLGPGAIGMFGIAGLAGAAVAPFAGKLADKRGPNTGIFLAISCVAASVAIFELGRSAIGWLIVGVIMLDVGVQAAQISNQAKIFALRSDARSRINTVYMVAYTLGGALGSVLSYMAWRKFGWDGVCTTGALAAFLAAVSHWRRPVKNIRVL